MSVQDAKAFVKKIASDEAFRAKMEQAKSDEDRKAIVKGAGLDFTKAELESVMPQIGKGKISEKDLEGVAGGSSGTWVAVALGATGAVAAAL